MTGNSSILEAFREAAERGGTVVAHRDGAGWAVRTVGNSGNEPRIEWVPRSPLGEGTATMFLEGLRQFFGDPIGREVDRQLGLTRGDGDALDARAVLDALDMATQSQAAFAGLNFISRNALSARGLSPQFRVVCMAAGVLPERIPAEDLQRIDTLFTRRFDERCDGDRRSVDLIEARLLMAACLAQGSWAGGPPKA